MTTLHLAVDRDINVPIHRQIRDGLRRAILEGWLRPGQRVPSTRSLAGDLGVSRLPVLSAYEQLLHEGYLVGRSGSGTFVSESVPDDLLRPVQANASAPRKSTGARARADLGRSASRDWNFPVVPFQVRLPALDLFPLAAWKKIIVRHLNAETPDRLSSPTPPGSRSFGRRSPSTSVLPARFNARPIRCW